MHPKSPTFILKLYWFMKFKLLGAANPVSDLLGLGTELQEGPGVRSQTSAPSCILLPAFLSFTISLIS